MQKYLLISLLACVSGEAMSQNLVSDSITLGANYTDHVLYDFATQRKTNIPKSSWDIGFNTKTTRGAAIIANYGIDVYIYPNGDTSVWNNTLDTAGISTWTKLYNSDTTWEIGAFNIPATNNQFDYGWGVYNMTNHYLYGHVIYIIKTQNGTYKKLWIKELNTAGQYTFTYADLDGANIQTKTFSKSTYNDQLLAQYSFTSNDFINSPKYNDWTVSFGQYYTEIPAGGSIVNYGVNGILLNTDVKAAKLSPVDPNANVDTNGVTFMNAINTIGYQWKTYVSSSNSYQIEDSTVYILKVQNNSYWKMVMTGFEGSSTGKVTFATERLSPVTNSLPPLSKNRALMLYPNPVHSGVLNIVIDLEAKESVKYTIYAITGQLMLEGQYIPQDVFSTYALDVNQLPSGNYIINISTASSQFQSKFSK